MAKHTPSIRKRLTRSKVAWLTATRGLRVATMDRAHVYPDLGLIYNRIKKSGNSSISLYLNELVAGESISAGTSMTRAAYRSELKNARSSGKRLEDLSVRELLAARRYYRFTIFRNPYARCLSGFLDKVASAKSRYSCFPGAGRQDADGFSDFVGFLETGGLWVNKHFWPQCDLLMAPPDEFDHVGQLENLREEMKRVCAAVSVTLPVSLDLSKPHSLERSYQGKVQGAAGRVAEFYDDSLYPRVAALYQQDFTVGRYDPAWRP
ncbi:sulfotransferase family 2 domain-containing protein [Thioalkalivibrio thiocyanoxidans]|uniref:sulfotransferase family 2 domain-containing protein n=1 Tax=Thioalkalivibrio thiocyanoxidans TaxID=152475 RepID=UPI001FCC13DC|nr:sulfotransferase family 2 domain-containing protein [Thioalkalivibrio thiocyanoxidans]